MPERRRVLVTGVATPVAARLARGLAAQDDVEHVAGIDLGEPVEPLGDAEFIRADLRSPLVARVIESCGADTLVHLGVVTTPGQVGGRARMKELNVIGTMQLLAAAQKAPRLRRVVVRSTTAVYGSHERNPSILAEDTATGTPPRSGYAKDAAEVESYARGLLRRRPDIALTVLRLASVIGPGVTTPLTGYLSLPVVPTVLGHDPRIQLLHEDDAVAALSHAALEPHPGVYNLAGRGVVYLSQAIRLAGKPSVGLPEALLPWLAGLARRSGRVDFSADQLQFLRNGRVGDTTRLEQRFGFVPALSTREALEAFLAGGDVEPLVPPGDLARLEERLFRLGRATVKEGRRLLGAEGARG